MPDPKHRLRVTEIDTVGFVDEGDNPAADIVFWKRKQEGEPMDNPETLSWLQKIYAAVKGKEQEPAETADESTTEDEPMAELNKSELPDEARAHIEALEAQVAELQAAATAEPEPEEPDVMKGIPDEARAEIEKRVAEAEARIAKAEKRAQEAEETAAVEKRERRLAGFRKQAEKDLVAIEGEVDEQAEMLMAIEDGLDEDMAKRVISALTAASSQLGANSKLVAEIGKHGQDNDPDSPLGKLTELAKARQTEDGVSFEKAFTTVLTDPANAAIASAYRNQR